MHEQAFYFIDSGNDPLPLATTGRRSSPRNPSYWFVTLYVASLLLFNGLVDAVHKLLYTFF